MVIIGPKWFNRGQNNTKYENGPNGPKQSWANNQIFEYSRIFWMNTLFRKNIHWCFLDQIDWDIHL